MPSPPTLLLTCVFGLIVSTHSGSSEAVAGDGPSFPRIANVYGVALTETGARVSHEDFTLEDVARCDLLIGVRGPGRGKQGNDLFQQQLAALKQINPHLIGLQFSCSAPYTHLSPTDEQLAARQSGQPFPWLLQTDGRLIAGWPGTHMLNLAFPAVPEWLAHQCVSAVSDLGYDGVFIDCMGPRFDRWACEIATGKAYTVDYDADGEDDDRQELDRIWKEAKTLLARRTRELLGPQAVFMANQAGEETYGHLNGIYLEDYVDAVIDGRTKWETVVEKYLHWTKTSCLPNVTVLGCSSGHEPPFEPYKLSSEVRTSLMDAGKVELQRMRFGLATTLMGDGYYSFDLHTRWRGQLWWYPEYDAPLGYPTQDASDYRDGTWRRRFDGGLVVVNPSSWDVTYRLDQNYRDVSSGQVSDSFTLASHDGRIYLPTNEVAVRGDIPETQPLLTWQGATGVVQRRQRCVVRNGKGMALLVNATGAIESIVVQGRELVTDVRTVIVKDKRWQNFAVTDIHHQVGDDGQLTTVTTRSDGDQVLQITQTVQSQEDRFEVGYTWRAVTALDLQAFRQAIHLPPEVFAGQPFHWEGGTVTLPAEVADPPNLTGALREASIETPGGTALSIKLSHAGHLIDERHYRGPGYLLAFHPKNGKIAAGTDGSYSIEVIVKQRTSK